MQKGSAEDEAKLAALDKALAAVGLADFATRRPQLDSEKQQPANEGRSAETSSPAHRLPQLAHRVGIELHRACVLTRECLAQ